MLNFGLLSVENTWMTNTTPINLEQFKSLVPFWFLLNGVSHNVHGMIIFGLWCALPKSFVVGTVHLNTDLLRQPTLPNALVNKHALRSWSFQILRVHSPNHYRNILSLNNRRQWDRYPLSVRNFRWLTSSARALFFCVWPCTFHITNHTKYMQNGACFHVSFSFDQCYL